MAPPLAPGRCNTVSWPPRVGSVLKSMTFVLARLTPARRQTTDAAQIMRWARFIFNELFTGLGMSNTGSNGVDVQYARVFTLILSICGITRIRDQAPEGLGSQAKLRCRGVESEPGQFNDRDNACE